MKISLLNDDCVNDNKGGCPVYINIEATFDTLHDLANIVQEYHIAIASYNDNAYRCGNNWISNDFMAFDFDDGKNSAASINQQLQTQSLNHVIIASKNHLKDKNDDKGVIERFHVFIPFSGSITTDPTLYGFITLTFAKQNKWIVDESVTKDKCRYYYKHRELLYIYESGSNLDTTRYVESKQKIDKIKREAPQTSITNKKFKVSIPWIKHTKYWRGLDLHSVGKRHDSAKKAFWFLLGHGIDRGTSIDMVLNEMGHEDYNEASKNLEKLYDFQSSHYGSGYLLK